MLATIRASRKIPLPVLGEACGLVVRAQGIFQCNEIVDLMSEIAASGTAVIVRKK
jgi:hypothetical protein